MQWDRSLAIGIAKASCTFCHGNGTRFRRNGAETAMQLRFAGCFSRLLESFPSMRAVERACGNGTTGILRGP